MLQIHDSGIGIPNTHLNRIFDPYFTAKQEGNGLGLATVYSIVKNCEGHIHIMSRLGEGTVCSIYLPAGEKGTQVHTSVDEISMEDTIPRKILLMDDEDLVTEVVAEMLKEFGCSVTVVTNGADALSKYQWAVKRAFHLIW